MRRFLALNFSFAPLLALVPGLMVLLAFHFDNNISGTEAFLSTLGIVLGGVWTGLKSTRALPDTLNRPLVNGHVDTVVASVILDALPDPVLLLDQRRQVLGANRAADELLGDGLQGRDVCLILRAPDAQRAINAALDGELPLANLEIVFATPVRRVYQIQVMPISHMASTSVRAVMGLHDVTVLKRAEGLRADFVANVSHELRSPLSSLTGFIETLQTTAKVDAQAQDRFLGIMKGEASRMTRLVDDLLSLSRIEANEHLRPIGRVNIADIIILVAQSLELRAAQKGMTIDTQVPHQLAYMIGDRDELHQVMQNLIDNAVTYGAADTAVTVTVRAIQAYAGTGQPGIEIIVQNIGAGISEKHLRRLTERFYRIDKGRSRASGGTGLGLAIVKHIVNHHRGRLLIDSIKGQGSSFSVQFPLKDA